MEILKIEKLYLIVSGMRIPSNLEIGSKISYYVFMLFCFCVGIGTNLLFLTVVLMSTWAEIISDLSLSCCLLTELLGLVKLIDCLRKREEFDKLGDRLTSGSSQTKSEKEEAIRQNYVEFSRSIILMLVVLGNSTVLLINLSHVINYMLDSNHNERPISDLLFATAFSSLFDITAANAWFFWTLQTVRSYLAAAWTVAYDVLYFGFLSELCAQIDILSHRMKILSPDEDREVLVEKVKLHIQHLDNIYSCAVELNKITRMILALQFCLTTFTISLTIVQFTLLSFQTSNVMDICMCFFYFMSIVTEFFLYCYFSNQLTTKSEEIFDSILEVDLDVLMKHKNYFCVMMQRTQTPIIMSGGPLINLTLSSFLKVIKTSYSAFNMLSESQQSQKN